jgi:hypothetical protein
MNKFLIIIMLVLIPACQPASKERLEETRQDLAQLSKVVKKLAESQKLNTEALTTYVEMPPEVKLALLQDIDNRVVEAKTVESHITENAKKECGIFNKGAFFAFVLNAYEVAKPVFKTVVKAAIDASKETPYGQIAMYAISALGAFFGKSTIDGYKEKKRLKRKALVAERHDPKDVEKHKAIEKAVDEDIRAGRVKI